jgi:hypothetical protein
MGTDLFHHHPGISPLAEMEFSTGTTRLRRRSANRSSHGQEWAAFRKYAAVAFGRKVLAGKWHLLAGSDSLNVTRRGGHGETSDRLAFEKHHSLFWEIAMVNGGSARTKAQTEKLTIERRKAHQWVS